MFISKHVQENVQPSLSHFLSPAQQSWGGGIGVATDVCPAVRLYVRILFPEQISGNHGGISFILHTHIPEGV